MELRHLRYFVAVAELGTVSGAAQALNTSQPSLSRQLHDLEERLGVALFERVGRHLHLTGAGEDLLGKAREVLNEAEGLRERARALRHGETGVLRVGATPQTIERLFPVLLKRFGALNPGVDVRLTEGHSRALADELRHGRLHLALTDIQSEWRDSAHLLGITPLLAISTRRLVESGNRIELRDLGDQPLLLFGPGYGSRDYFEAACALARIKPNIYMESGAANTLLALARAGRGIAVLPATVAPAGNGLEAHELVQDGTPLELRFAVHWNPDRFLPGYARQFIDELEAVAHEQYSAAPDTWRLRLD